MKLKKRVVCKGLCRNSKAYRWCHVPMTLWALSCLCRASPASVLFHSGPPLSHFLLCSLFIQRQWTLDLCSIVPFTVASETYPPLAQTCLNLRSDSIQLQAGRSTAQGFVWACNIPGKDDLLFSFSFFS